MPLPLFHKNLDLKLLKLVKENPILYNTSHSNYLNFDAREVVWQKIGDALNRPAVVFAGIQCQIHFGDFQEEKHKPGYIENLSEYLPEQYASAWGVEKKILKDYRTHQGLSPLDAKYLYIKTARDLPTYGVTFFLVKEKQKNRKKLVPRLLGINADSILRLDEVTKEIMQVWPLTHVKTYHVGKSETFTLSFGDYSDKEYSVKTQDAYRIRDILEGYIDLIRKRMLAGREAVGSEGIVIMQDNVEPSRGNIMHIVANNPSKVVEQSFVGPSKLVPYADEMHAGQRSQVVTVQQMVVTGVPNNPQQAKSEVPMRHDMSMECVRRLNRLNSQSVTLVALLSDPNEDNIREARRTVDAINTDIMPVLIEGLNKTVQKQSTEEAKKKMLDEIKELEEYVKNLTDSMKADVVKCGEAEETSMKIANLTTQMYAALDPQTKRRSDLIRSFIADEKMDSNLRRASFIAAATTALHNVEDVQKDIGQGYQGHQLSKSEIEDIERSAVDKIGKLNAAIALYLTAHTDPKNIDYSTALNSMNTIKELMPELAKDAKALGSVKDNKNRQQLLDGIRALCESTKTICTLTGSEDHQKMQDASNKYADVSRKLIFTIGKGVDKNKESEIVKLAKTVQEKAVAVQKTSSDLVGKAKTPEANEIHEAGAHVVNCAKDLMACAKVTGPSPHEAHCRSALLAAAANTSAANKALLQRAPQDNNDKLRAKSVELEKALDAINETCSKIEDADAKALSEIPAKSPEELLRLEIVKTISAAKNNLQTADNELNKPDINAMLKKGDAESMQKQLAQKLAQMNAALASLVGAHSNRSNPDHETAKDAIATFTELLPEVVRSAKTLCGSMDPSSREALLEQVRTLSQASADICSCYDNGKGVNEAAVKFSNASGRLVFTLTPKQDTFKGQDVIDLSSAACDKASKLLTNVHQLADKLGGSHGAELDVKGVIVVDTAQALLTAAQVTAPTMSDPRCQSSMLSSIDALSASSQQLAQAWRNAPSSAHHQALEAELQDLEKILEHLRNTCQYTPAGSTKSVQQPVVSPHEVQRLKFVKTVSRAKRDIEAADEELNKPDICQMMRQEDAELMQQRLSDKIQELNAAVAALLAATSDRNKPDFAAIEESVGTISKLLPQVAKDSKTISSSMEPASRDDLLAKVRALCDASKDICVNAESGKGLDAAASKFADASGKLVFTLTPKPVEGKEQQVLDLTAAACTTASQLLSNVKLSADELGGESGHLLDRKGADVADRAQALLLTAQKTAPTMSDASSRSDLLSKVEDLSTSSQGLANTWRHMPVGVHQQILEKELQELEKVLGQLRGACQSAADDEVKKAVEVRRLQFVKSAAGARKNLETAHEELNKSIPTAPLNQEQVVDKQHKLHQSIAELNAAVAALLAATQSRSRADYASAEKAVETINNLLPEVVKDAKSLSASQSTTSSEALLKHVRALCDASRDVCASVENGQGLSESASKFADASGKLVFVVTPKPNVTKEQQVLDLTAAACGSTSQLLYAVQQAAQQLGGQAGGLLDSRGATVADQAQALLVAAQEKAPTISEPGFQSAILSVVDAVSGSSQELADTWRAMPVGAAQHALERELQELENILGQLRAACQSAAAPVVKEKSSVGDIQRIKFVKTVAVAKKKLDTVDDELKKPAPTLPLPREQAANTQHELQQNIAQMNGAVAAFISSTADRSNPDYATAEQALGTVSIILPQVVKDAKALSSSQDPAGREALMERIRALCEASKDVFASAENGQGVNDAASKYANASGKLVYVINPRVDVAKGQQVLDLSAVACGTASQLLSNVQQASEQVGGEAGLELDRKGAVVADNAQALLSAAQVTAPSISDPHCQASLLSSVDALDTSSSILAQAWKPLPPAQQQPLEREHQELQKVLNQIRAACRNAQESALPSKLSQDVQRMKFIKSVSGVRKNLEAADVELNKPVTSPPLRQEDVHHTQQMLQDKIAQLNAAIGALVVSTADRSNPDYASAEQAVASISDLLPQVVTHAKTLSTSRDPSTSEALLKRVQGLCEASKAVCHSAETGQGLNDAALKYANVSGDLVYVVNPKTDAAAEQKVLDLSAAACGTASQLLSNVQQVSEQVGGDAGVLLDRKGAIVADHAQALLTTAQVTAPLISDPTCKSSLLSSVDALGTSSRDLANTWRPLPKTPHHDTMEKEFEQLNQILYELRKPCEQTTEAIDVQQKRTSTHARDRPEVGRRAPPPPAPRPHAPHARRTSVDLTRDFLHRMRMDEEQDKIKQSVHRQSTIEGDEHQQQFSKTVDVAAKTIGRAEEELRQLCHSKTSPAPGQKLNLNQQAEKQKQLQEKLALANVEVAALVGANYADKIDYNTASKSMSSLPQLLTGIVEDGKLLSNSFSDDARKAFLDDMLNFCGTTSNLCETAKNDRQKLKEAAVRFGDKSAKIMYTVSSEVDPQLKKQIISTAKEIGDSASRLAIVSSALGDEPHLTKSAAATIDSAGALLYTAKLLSPTIHDTTCKEALLASANKLSNNLNHFSDCWRPMASVPQHATSVKELTEETQKMEQLLEHLRRSARGRQVVEKEKIVVEDTPLRILACKILDDAQKMSEVSELPVSARCEYAQYCDAIRNAITQIDEAAFEAKKTPANINKHRELENAIQNLQMVMLQNRPKRDGKERTNIVDLREYIQDVTNECDEMAATANKLNETTRGGNPNLENLIEECEKMSSSGNKLLDPAHCSGGDTTVDDILDIDNYGQNCDSRISEIKSRLSSLQDDRASSALHPRYQALVESCNMLRFATKSALSTAQSASLDATLSDLQDLETKVVEGLMDEDDDQVVTIRQRAAPAPRPWLKLRVSQSALAVRRGGAGPCAASAYAADALARAHALAPEEKNRLQQHLSKLIYLLKLLTVVTSKRVATWQDLNHPELTTITDQILEELEKPESGYGAESGSQLSMLSTEDIKKLLTPTQQNIAGDKKQVQDKVQKASGKLSMMCSNLAQGSSSDAARSRTAHAASQAAAELAVLARALKDGKDPIQSNSIEEAAQEMSYSTYNLLATSEYVSQRPNNPSSRMKLLEALRQLNDSINKLTRATCPESKLQQSCEEVSRSLQLQQSTLATPRSTCALPYSDCVDALTSQQEIIDKLKSDAPLSRQEFVSSLGYVSSAVCNCTHYAAQCAYLVSISDSYKEVAKQGLVDTHKIQKSLASIEDTCVSIICTGHIENMQEESIKLQKQVASLSEELRSSCDKIQDDKLKRRFSQCKDEVNSAADAVCRAIAKSGTEDKAIRKQTMALLTAVNKTAAEVDDPALLPQAGAVHPDTQTRCDELMNNSRALITKTQALVKEVKSSPEGPDVMTWVTFNMGRKEVLEAFDALLKSIQVNGKRSGILEGSFDDVDEGTESKKSYVQVQLETANKWLQRPACKADTKAAGEQAVKNIVEIGKKMAEDMKPNERQVTEHLISEIERLQSECSTRYDQEKYSLLMERLKDLKKIIERDLVTRVVEELIDEEDPLEDLEVIADAEKDESKRKYLLEMKIAELLAQLGRMTKVARFVADAGNGSRAVSNELRSCSDQSELLAPMLVKAAQERINKPNDQAVVDHYKSLLAQYAESLSKVRDLCDQAVDPMEFVQTAGVVMERMKEEAAQPNDSRACIKKSNVITKLANRVITVSMSSNESKRDPELQRVLSEARTKLRAALPAPGDRASRFDWGHATTQILRTTGEVESVLGGENIFKKQPEPDQPIYSVALDLHASVREWSSRDNEIVAVARRMAVLMARLSDYMNTDKQRELLQTSKQIVSESHEVAYLAKKMAHECTDVRIKTNLLLACERIPTISAQLKMLTTVKGSSLGQQGTKEDKEAMTMLVGNAQSLMLSIQDVVKGAASASVKIQSQHGPRNRWVRRNYY